MSYKITENDQQYSIVESDGTYTITIVNGSNITNFTNLLDTPGTYVGQAGKFPRVNTGETALEFVASSATDGTAIHTDAANEITGITEKTAVVGNDEIVIEDSEAGYAKKSVKISNLPTGSSYTDEQAQDAVGAMVSAEFTYTDGTPLLAINSISADKITDGTTNKAFTATEQSKLAGIATGAEVNVNADWNAASGDAQILNKPTIPDSLDDLSGTLDSITAGTTNVHLTSTLKSNYDAAYSHSGTAHAPADAEKNVQADWNQADNAQDDYIKNKPTITAPPTTEEIQDIVGAMVSGNTETGISVSYDDTNGKLDFSVTASGTGDVIGPASSTDNAITRFDGATGKAIQNSSVTVDDNGSVNIPTGQAYKINGTALSYSDVGAAAALGVNDNYVTDAEKIVIGNTSGTNSGDNATNTQYSGLATSKLSLDQTTSQSIINGQPIQDTLTASELVATDASKKLSSLAVATYPSLTELSYVKGVTSGIQSQLNGKQATLTFGIADTNKVQINAADVADNDYAKFTATGLEGRSYAEVLSDIGAQAALVSGTSIKTINSTSLLGSGDIAIVGLTDGDKGDITIGSSGTTMTIENGAVTEAKQTLADNTTCNVSTSAHGYAPKAPNDTQKFLRGDASYAIPTILDLGALSTTNETYSGIISTETVDTNSVGFGCVLAIAADGNYDEADADAIANAYNMCLALETGTGTKKVLRYGRICDTDWTWTVGGTIYLSTTLGTMTQTAPTGADDTVIILGWATHADAMVFNPYVAHMEHTG